MAGRATFFFRTRYSTQCPWPGYFDGVKIHVHCSPHLIMGIHCFYTARLTTDSFICGVEQLSFAVGGHRGTAPSPTEGALQHPGTLHHQYIKLLTDTRTTGLLPLSEYASTGHGHLLRRYATLRVGGSIFKAPFHEKPSISISNPTYFGGGAVRRNTFFVSAKQQRRATEGTHPRRA